MPRPFAKRASRGVHAGPLALCLAIVACGRVSFEPRDAGPIDSGPTDAGPTDAGPTDAGPPDAGPPDAGFVRGDGPFDPPIAIMMLNRTGFADLDLTLTPDELEVFFITNRRGSNEVWTATRSDVSEPFDNPSFVPELTLATPFDPEISRDGLTIRVTYHIPLDEIRESRRAARGATWSTPVAIAELNDPGGAANCCATANRDDTIIVLSSARGGLPAADLFLSRRALATDPWGMPVAAPELNSTSVEVNPYLRDDGLLVMFDSTRAGGVGARDLYEARRTSVDLPFDPPTPLMGINTSFDERDAWLSEDGHRLYFVSDRTGDTELYVAAR